MSSVVQVAWLLYIRVVFKDHPGIFGRTLDAPWGNDISDPARQSGLGQDSRCPVDSAGYTAYGPVHITPLFCIDLIVRMKTAWLISTS